MATLIDPDFRARLDALRDKYAAGVPGLLAGIGQALARCRAERWSAPASAELHTALHTVAGSGATFGFAVLGQECRQLEQALRSLVDGGGADAPGWAALGAGVERLLTWAANDPKGGPPA
ncbi:HPt (histidine-containing phosphotransfer) domain-containing protein [Janthinobacterium sp. CG_23.3]|uniref:Hpt domain-containing protein n=1 Tax=unclassified Janthinobacterium TaxID=2610881 RepID=UPI00034855D1|nr:Hpt domain-containing protein [Janthinobacterium sp. CG3]